jgi:hypothetical protein
VRREVKEALLGTMSVSGLSICRLVPLTHLTINCCMGIIVQWKTPVCIKVCYYTYEPERTKVLHKIFCDNCIKSWPSERCFKVGATLLGAFMQSLMVKHTTNIFQRTLFPSRVNNLTGFTQRERAAVTLKSFVLNWYTCRLARLVHLTKCHVITCNSTAPYGCLL